MAHDVVYVCKYSQVAGYLADCVKWFREGTETV